MQFNQPTIDNMDWAEVLKYGTDEQILEWIRHPEHVLVEMDYLDDDYEERLEAADKELSRTEARLDDIADERDRLSDILCGVIELMTPEIMKQLHDLEGPNTYGEFSEMLEHANAVKGSAAA